MMWAPFVADSDDQLQQFAQFQVFLTLVASIGLRMTPPSNTLATIMSVLMVATPFIAILMETPLVSEVRGGVKMVAKAMKLVKSKEAESKTKYKVAQVAPVVEPPPPPAAPPPAGKGAGAPDLEVTDVATPR